MYVSLFNPNILPDDEDRFQMFAFRMQQAIKVSGIEL